MNDSIPLNIILGSSNEGERRDAVENRRRILETAVRLFAERGVPEVNMADIADAAGVGKGTLYRRFANKGALCLALMDDQLTDFQNRMLAQMREMTAVDTPKLQQLDLFVEALVFFIENHIPLLCEVQRASAEHEGDFGVPHYWQYWTVHGLLQTAVAHDELSADLDIPFLADLLLAPLSAQFYRFQREVRAFPPERISAGLRTFIASLPKAKT